MYKTVSIFILALAFIVGLLFFYNPKPAASPAQSDSSVSDTEQKWESRTDNQANVVVTVTPYVLSVDSKEWKFDIVLDTHSVELDQDMAKIAVLVDGNGKEYKAVKWEGSEPGGHHREGVLIFKSTNPLPSYLELKIKNIGGVSERLFKWNLE
ncbi:MAG: hypothetical protein AAB719_00945 [Patescibacteria group bacterium]